MQWNPRRAGCNKPARRGGIAFRATLRDNAALFAALTIGARAMQKALRKEKHAEGREHHAADLRSTLDWLRGQGDLIETDKAVDPDLEVTGLQKHMDGG